jgi:hypothetical protein
MTSEPFIQSTDLSDLEAKLKCVVNFAIHVCQPDMYGDYLQTFILSTPNNNQKKLRVYWGCTAFCFTEDEIKHCNDKRHHEQLIHKYFKTLNVTITKCLTRWELLIDTPVDNQPIHSLMLTPTSKS